MVCLLVRDRWNSIHTGIWILQGLDFISYWSPIFLSFIVFDSTLAEDSIGSPVRSTVDTTKWIQELFSDATNTDDIFLMLCGCGCALYGVGQFVVAATFWDTL